MARRTAEPMTTETAADLLINRRALAQHLLMCNDHNGWCHFVAWANGSTLSWRQMLRVQWVLNELFMCSDATAREQDAAAHSFDDEGDVCGVRSGLGSETYRLLLRARVMTGRERGR